jgi:bifunctional non-homologous end joining protein LigD
MQKNSTHGSGTSTGSGPSLISGSEGRFHSSLVGVYSSAPFSYHWKRSADADYSLPGSNAPFMNPAVPASPQAPAQDITREGVTLTHPDKVLYVRQGITKQELAEYYLAVAEWILPYVANRPLSVVRCPRGNSKTCFFQRHATPDLPQQILPVRVPGSGQMESPYMMIKDVKGLMALTQSGVLELHPWAAKVETANRPDSLTIDLDPHEDMGWSKVKEAALEVRDRLDALGLQSFLKLTGGKGLHVVAPINQRPDWDTVKNFTRILAQNMVKDSPELYTAHSRKSQRRGKIFIDYLRNEYGASAIAPYSTRCKASAPIAMPIDWEELPEITRPDQYTLRKVRKILASRVQDPWEEMRTLRQELPA